MNDKILWDIIDGLRDELSIAQDGITDLRDKLFYDEVKELQAELDKEKEFAIETSIKNDRLMSQVSSNRGNSSSTHTHTKETEIDAEMIDKHGNVKTIKCYTKDM